MYILASRFQIGDFAADPRGGVEFVVGGLILDILSQTDDPFGTIAEIRGEPGAGWTTAAIDALHVQGRLTRHTYWSMSWILPGFYGPASGHHGRFVYRVLEQETLDATADKTANSEGEWTETLEVTLRENSRLQHKAIVGREAGNILDFRIQQIPARDGAEAKTLVRLSADEAWFLPSSSRRLNTYPLPAMKDIGWTTRPPKRSTPIPWE